MRNTLLVRLGTLMCALAVCASVSPVTDFDGKKMAGKWYMVGFGTNATWFANYRARLKTGTVMFKPTEAGDLDLLCSNLRDDGSCWRMTDLAKKTDTPGQFTFHSQLWSNNNDMRIVDVLYDDYALVHIIKTKDKATDIVNILFSRTKETTVALHHKFTELSRQTGIVPQDIVLLPKNSECPEV